MPLRLKAWGAKGSGGDSGHLYKTEFFVHLISCKLAESSSITLIRTPQVAGEFGGCSLVLLGECLWEHMCR